jgi:hypothetical protein
MAKPRDWKDRGVTAAGDEAAVIAARIDTSRPHQARVYDYLLGGKDNFAVDRDWCEQALRVFPSFRVWARENRAFVGRAVRFLVRECGIRQFLDIGTGLPTANNVHQVAQRLVPSCRVVYVDNDPIVLAHARALLASHPDGRTAYVDADLRQPEKILSHPDVRATLDFSQPIGLLLVAILHALPDEDQPRRIVETLVDALPPGSYLAATHPTGDFNPDAAQDVLRMARESGMMRGRERTGDEIEAMVFSGLELVPPGMVLTSEWRPGGEGPRPLPHEVSTYAGVGRKP